MADTCPPKFRRRRVADGTGQGRTKYAQYTYLGAAIVVQAAHPAVNGGLTLSYGSPADPPAPRLRRAGSADVGT